MRKAFFASAISCIASVVSAQSTGPIVTTITEPKTEVFQCNPGPWGDLEYYPVHLEAPDHTVELVTAPSARTSWFFPGKSLEEIRALLTAASISGEDQDRIIEESNATQLPPPYRLYPPLEVVEGMTPRGREILYASLRPWSENRFHHSPVIIESGDVTSWFADSELSFETIARISAMTYRIGPAMAFSDVSAILANISTDHEERAFLKALTRTRSLMLRLKISPDSDFAALKDYWSMGSRISDVIPYFESISQTPGIEKIDIIHLLPPTPRKHLNTFPTLSLGIEGQFPGSFWTSLNFVRYRPLIEFDDPEYSKAYTRQFMEPAMKPYTFGDLLMITNPASQRTYHTCVYIADDIVYTKNGRSILRPFMLMKLPDLMTHYSTDSPPAISVWRHKAP